jgi:hypothetical protein
VSPQFLQSLAGDRALLCMHLLSVRLGFDCSPTGRIMNRLSKDMSDVDMRLPFLWSFFINFGTQILTTIGVVAYSAPWLLIAFFVVGVVCKLFCRLLVSFFAVGVVCCV